MLRLFRRKMFFKKCSRHFLVFGGEKIMVNGNHFQFDSKSLINFWKAKIVNRFLDLNSSFLHAHL
jgi:hypothetical protein